MQALAAFRLFLERGGRLLVASGDFYQSSEISLFQQEMFYVGKRKRSTTSTIRTLDSNQALGFSVTSTPMELIAPAEPILLNAGGEPVGMYLNTGTG
jgi:hypothetical protein